MVPQPPLPPPFSPFFPPPLSLLLFFLFQFSSHFLLFLLSLLPLFLSPSSSFPSFLHLPPLPIFFSFPPLPSLPPPFSPPLPSLSLALPSPPSLSTCVGLMRGYLPALCLQLFSDYLNKAGRCLDLSILPNIPSMTKPALPSHEPPL